APAASTRSRPGSPAPSRGGWPRGRSTRRAVFLSRVLGVGAGQPVLGPLPADAQALEGQADGLAAEDPGGPALLETGLGRQAECPQAGRLAQAARALVEQGAQVLVAVLGPGGVDGLGGLGLGPQAGRGLGVDGVDRVADRLAGAAEGGGDRGGAL